MFSIIHIYWHKIIWKQLYNDKYKRENIDYGDTTTYNESNFEYISKDKQNYLGSIENIFSSTGSSGSNIFVPGHKIYVTPIQILKRQVRIIFQLFSIVWSLGEDPKEVTIACFSRSVSLG